jgi:hypothetical protein
LATTAWFQSAISAEKTSKVVLPLLSVMPEAYGLAPRRTGPEPGYAIQRLVCVRCRARHGRSAVPGAGRADTDDDLTRSLERAHLIPAAVFDEHTLTFAHRGDLLADARTLISVPYGAQTSARACTWSWVRKRLGFRRHVGEARLRRRSPPSVHFAPRL